MSSSSYSSTISSSSNISLLSDFEDMDVLVGNQANTTEKFNIIDCYNEHEFKRRFRLSKSTIIRIHDIVGKQLQTFTDRGKPISSLNQILLCLRFYATNSFQLIIGDNYSVSQSTMCRIIVNVSRVLASLRPVYIQMPTANEIPTIKQAFYAIKRFPGVIGAIDCTHIKILSPGGDQSEIFRNRKSFLSINTQMVCDPKLKIRDVVARWPGSTHDSRIYDNSLLKAQLESGEISGYLLGDSGYACSSVLLTPILTPVTESQRKYNQAHKTTRNTVERCFGLLKRRFPVLSSGIRTRTQTALAIIVACSVLHNIAIEERELLIDNDEAEEYSNDEDTSITPVTVGSFSTRNEIIRTYFST